MGAKMKCRDFYGSPARDKFRWLHKQPPMDERHYASDGDLFAIEFDRKIPVAYFDIKASDDDKVTDTENVLYQWIEESGCPVYLLWVINMEVGHFKVDRWNANGKYEYVKTIYTWNEFNNWEWELRQKVGVLI
jgi:hypothetical protein